MSRKQRLELTWIGKDERPRLEPRILIEDAEKSYHAPRRITECDIFDNRVIFGDNLLALKALEQELRLSLLSLGALPSEQGLLGQLGHPRGLQPRHARRGGVQADGVRLCA